MNLARSRTHLWTCWARGPIIKLRANIHQTPLSEAVMPKVGYQRVQASGSHSHISTRMVQRRPAKNKNKKNNNIKT